MRSGFSIEMPSELNSDTKVVNPLETENTGGKGRGEGTTSSFLKVSGQHGVAERAKDETPEDLVKIDSSVTYSFCDLQAAHFTSLSPSFFIYKIALSSQSALHHNQLDMLQPDSQQRRS